MRGAAQADGVQLEHHQVVDQILRQIRVLAQREGDILVHRLVGKERAELEQHAYLAPHRVQPFAVERPDDMTEHARLAGARAQRPHDHPQQRGLAATGLPHDADDRAALDGEIDVTQHRSLWNVAEGELPDLDDGLRDDAVRGRRLLHGVILSRMGEGAADQHDAGAPAVRIDSLCKRYGKTLALNEVTLRIERREAFGLVGANGAGKSTLIRCLLDLAAAERGRIELFGVPARQPLARARLAYL